jgi:3',5'-cyclic AMP phosphodiesterase CpdA
VRRESPAPRWALLADTHLSTDSAARYESFRPHECAAAVVAEILDKPLDGTIINGDIAWLEGLPEDYTAAGALLGPLAEIGPLVTTPGNHDRRDNLCAVFSDPRVDERAAKVMSAVDVGPVLLVGLDSLIDEGVVPGRLAKPQLEWLDEWLSANHDKPVLLFVHHPLNDDENGLLDGDALLDVAAQHPHVKAIFTAHDHVYSFREQDGLIVVTQPAVGFAFDESEMHGWLEAEFRADGMTLTSHPLSDDPSTSVDLTWLR